MKKYINVETLKAEINRRIRENSSWIASRLPGSELASAVKTELEQINAFIDSLQGKEPVANVEKVAEECWRTDFNMENDQYVRLSMRHDDFINFARYFAEVGERAERERIRSAVEEIKKQYQAVDKCLNDIKNLFV